MRADDAARAASGHAAAPPSLKPEPEDLVKIEAKLKSGLPDDTAPAAEAEHKKPGGG
jgi:hypothetical protein